MVWGSRPVPRGSKNMHNHFCQKNERQTFWQWKTRRSKNTENNFRQGFSLLLNWWDKNQFVILNRWQLIICFFWVHIKEAFVQHCANYPFSYSKFIGVFEIKVELFKFESFENFRFFISKKTELFSIHFTPAPHP